MMKNNILYTAPAAQDTVAAVMSREPLVLSPRMTAREALALQYVTEALAQEKEQFGYIRVIFPETAGVPPEFEQISQIILDIIPCHLEVEFYFRYLTWAECHAHGYTWAVVHQNQWTWQEFQLAI